MGGRRGLVALLALGSGFVGVLACTSFDAGAPDRDGGSEGAVEAGLPPEAAPSVDAAAEADAGAPCDLTATWGPPSQIVLFGTSNGTASLSEDELTILFDNLVPSGPRYAIFVAQRSTNEEAFTKATEIGAPVASASDTYQPALSSDGRTLWFASNRPGGFYRLWKTTRPNVESMFGEPFTPPAFAVIGAAIEGQPFVTADGAVWFASNRLSSGDFDVYRSSPLSDGGYTTPIAVADLNSTASESKPVLSRDGLTVFFGSARKAGTGNDIWTATRANKGMSFGTPVSVPELNTPSDDIPTWISADSCRLYMCSDRGSAGVLRIYVSSRRKN